MDISKLSKKPELVKMTLDDENIVEEFGEAIDFWILDSMSLTTYFNFYKLQQEEDDTLLYDLLRRLILKEDGKPAIAKDEIIPVSLTMGILVKISDFLGKSKPKTSTQESGTTQK